MSIVHTKKLVKYLVRVRVSAYSFVKDWVRVGIRLELVRVTNSHSGPPREQVKKGHVTVECKVINHHPRRFHAQLLSFRRIISLC